MNANTMKLSASSGDSGSPPDAFEYLLESLTPTQGKAVTFSGAPLLIIAGAGTGKTTVITRRIAWMLCTEKARSAEILALTFTEKAASEMQERVDLLMPYGYVDVALRTFHAFGDQLLREHAAAVGLSANFRVLSKAEQLVFIKQHLFDLPLKEFRPLHDPARFVDALTTLFSRAKDEAVTAEDFLRFAKQQAELASADPSNQTQQIYARRVRELAETYAAYASLLRTNDLADFGDQVFLALQLVEQHPEVREKLNRQLRHVLVDEFQDTNYAQFRLLQLLAGPETAVTVVADDDQSIYKWRGAAISNVVKFIEAFPRVETIVLKENFRSSQSILDAAYRLIQFNNPDRLEVRQGIDKRLIAVRAQQEKAPDFRVFDTSSSEADWVAEHIRELIESGRRKPTDIAILVRSNREADIFLRALNVAGIPWHFSGASGLLSREESKMLLSCLKMLADPEDSLSWFNVSSSPLYQVPMADLMALLSQARVKRESFSGVLSRTLMDPASVDKISTSGQALLRQLLDDVQRLTELSRKRSPGQVLFQWLSDRGFLKELGRSERLEDLGQLQTVARFFDQLRRLEALVEPSLPSLMDHLEIFEAMGNEPIVESDAWAERVSVLTLHKAKGLEFPVVFLVGLVQGRFPTPQRKETIELPEPLIRDLLPTGDYHLQEERRLFYVGMTRAKEELNLTCAYDYGGKSVRKVSQFVVEALELASPSPAAKIATAREKIARHNLKNPLAIAPLPSGSGMIRLDAYGVDDYLTCPFKYRYSHVLRLPVMRHHLVIYGSALHKAVEQFFSRRIKGEEMQEEELLAAFRNAWLSEGFLTKEHEQLRLAQGEEALRRFFAKQAAYPERPTLIEEKFSITIGDVIVSGRWDRVDERSGEAVIIDYKSSEVHDQKAADKRTQESLQLLIYALAWQKIHGKLPTRVELHFLETGMIGQAVFDEADIGKSISLLQQVKQGIQARNFKATPGDFSCRWCAYQAICPSAFQSTKK